MHHLPEPAPAVQEMIRATRDGHPFMVRDLRRPRQMLLEWYVRWFGRHYDPIMKRMYRESLQAGFTTREMRALAGSMRDAAVRVHRFFITHVGIHGVRRRQDVSEDST